MAENKADRLFGPSGGKLLVLHLGQQSYGIQILDTREVVKMMDVEPIPNCPPHIKGVINLRGKIIPVVDFRCKLGMKSGEQTEENCILVLDVSGRQTGVIIDALVGVLTVDRQAFQDRPDMGSQDQENYITGIVKQDEHLITVLDMTQVLGSESIEVNANSAVLNV